MACLSSLGTGHPKNRRRFFIPLNSPGYGITKISVLSLQVICSKKSANNAKSSSKVAVIILRDASTKGRSFQLYYRHANINVMSHYVESSLGVWPRLGDLLKYLRDPSFCHVSRHNDVLVFLVSLGTKMHGYSATKRC